MSELTGHSVVRVFLGTATWGSLGLGLLTRDVRWFMTAGALGTIWWLADFLWNRIMTPLGGFLAQAARGEGALPPPGPLLSVEDTVRLLEAHIEGDSSRHVQIQAALRLADLYRAAYHDNVRALEIIERVRTRFPDAKELANRDQSDAH
jgi:hypothetical protein